MHVQSAAVMPEKTSNTGITALQTTLQCGYPRTEGVGRSRCRKIFLTAKRRPDLQLIITFRRR